MYLIGEGKDTGVTGGGDTQVRHPVPYGCQSGAGQEREEGKGCQHHLGQLEGSLPPDEVEQTLGAELPLVGKRPSQKGAYTCLPH